MADKYSVAQKDIFRLPVGGYLERFPLGAVVVVMLLWLLLSRCLSEHLCWLLLSLYYWSTSLVIWWPCLTGWGLVRLLSGSSDCHFSLEFGGEDETQSFACNKHTLDHWTASLAYSPLLFWNVSHLNGCEMAFHGGFKHVFWVISGVECLFISVLATLMPSLEKCPSCSGPFQFGQIGRFVCHGNKMHSCILLPTTYPSSA